MRDGFAGVSMRRLVEEIAKRRRLTKPAIYYHFPDKQALYAAVLLDVTARYGGQLRAAAAATGGLRARLVALGEVLLRLRPEALTRMRLDVEQHLAPDARVELHRAFERDIRGPVLAAFEQAARDGGLREGIAPSVAAAAFLSLVGGLAAGGAERPTGNTPEMAADLLLGGVARP